MAGAEDPFTPGPTADPTAGIPNMDTFEGIRNQWSTFLDQPGARTALLQTGIALMQTPQFGQTPTGQIGAAIGAGGEAVSRQQAEQSKQDLEAARAEAAGSRAGEAQQRLGLEYFRRQSIERGQEASRQAHLFGLHAAYNKTQETTYQRDMHDWHQNNDHLPEARRAPKPERPQYLDFETWARTAGYGGPVSSAGPAVGTVMTGAGGKKFRFKGGNPGSPVSWGPAEEAAPAAAPEGE